MHQNVWLWQLYISTAKSILNLNLSVLIYIYLYISSSIQSKYLTMKGKNDLQFSSKQPEEEENLYETVSSSTLEAIHSLRILPAKPLQESEYAGNVFCLWKLRKT